MPDRVKRDLGSPNFRPKIVILGFSERDDRVIENRIQKCAPAPGRDVVRSDFRRHERGFSRRPASLIAVFVSCQYNLYTIVFKYGDDLVANVSGVEVIHVRSGCERWIMEINDAPELTGRAQVIFQPLQHWATGGYSALQRLMAIQRYEMNIAPVERIVLVTIG